MGEVPDDVPCGIAVLPGPAYAFLMPEPAQSVSQRSGSFASLLASFTRKLQDDNWDDSALANDVATLTYEQALLATRPNRVPETTVPVLHDKLRALDSSSSAVHGQAHRTREKKPKSASITIRVTPEEQAQLHERASAAHLTVSAYLRSCIFEAESLRSQVKEALAEMQSTQSEVHPIVEPPSGWRKLFLPIWPQNKLPRAAS